MDEQDKRTEERQDGQPDAQQDNSSNAPLADDAIQNIIDNMRDKVLAKMIIDVGNEKTKRYILSRVIPQMDYYSKKSGENKKKYTLFMTISIVLGALIPVFSVLIPTDFSETGIATPGLLWAIKVLIAALGAGVTALNAYMSLHNFKDLWTTYRNTREALLRTLYAYFNNADRFAQEQTQDKRDALLIRLCEDELARENGSWRALVEE